MKYIKEKDFIIKAMKDCFEKHGKKPMNVAQKSSFDLVTDIDCAIEKEMTGMIEETFPGDKVIGEEFSSNGNTDGRFWTIDPIDGTCNMAKGVKLYGVQCSLVDNGEVVLGAMYLPFFDEMIYAIKNEGCYLNDEQVFVNSAVKPNEAIVSFADFPHKQTTKAADLQHRAIGKLYSTFLRIRMFGAACLDFSSVALGRTDATVVITTNLWDLLPGVALCREAGAVVTNFNGEPYKFGDEGVIAAANEEIKDLLVKNLDRSVKVCANGEEKKIEGVIFDFDGVVFDTEKYHYQSWCDGYATVGGTLTKEEYLPLKSTGGTYIVNFLENKMGKKLSETERKGVIDRKNERYDELVAHFSEDDFIKGAKEFISYLHSKSVRTAVASSSCATIEMIERFKLDKLFDCVIDGNTPLPRKPAPDIFLTAAKKMHLNPENCIVFEDSLAGIKAAANASIPVVAVGGVSSGEEWFKIEDFSQIDEYIN